MPDKQEPVYVTKSFLPPREEFDTLVDEIWKNNQLTNNGPLSDRFTESVCKYLDVDKERFIFVANGTLALQLALHQLIGDEIGADIITTPFTYVATTSAILWERYTPIFVDIKPDDFTIDPTKIEAAITPKTRAILAVHVFGNPCDVEAIEAIAKKHNLKVIYDAAHAFGVTHKGKSILEYGDISILSFHATKLMHTIEGGAVYARSTKDAASIELTKRFGHNGDTHIQLGINAKANEFQAAMGIANLKYADENVEARKKISLQYSKLLFDRGLGFPIVSGDTCRNYSYYPVVFQSEDDLLAAFGRLAEISVFPRRYFYPSLNELSYVENAARCPISEDIAKRSACLPLYAGLAEKDVTKICRVINETQRR